MTASKTDTEKFHTGIFERLPEEKQERILNIAVKEFATNGFLNSRIKTIAHQAGISYGSIYSYFPTKDDLLRTIIRRNVQFQKKILAETVHEDTDVYTNLENYFRLSLKIAREKPELIAIWRDIAQAYHTKFMPEILELEKEGLKTLRELVERGIATRFLSPDINIDASVYIIDSISSELLASCVSAQNREKKRLFFGGKSDNLVVEEIMSVVKRILPTR
jgi:TetR/AcrR family fatty acid metabolism transcriptional regulator